MLNRDDNELLTRVGPGTAMGALFRRHWLPFMLADELVAEAPPKRVRLLGEPLVAFRDSRGRPGLLGEHCPHRRASLALGRNEAHGLRCAYHGWKFDVSGRCLDMPSEPAGSGFREKVRAAAYRVTERGGLLWAYLGPEEKRAELPELEWLGVPATRRQAARHALACNYAQALEGEIDESRAAPPPAAAARYTVHETAYGLACGARRAADADRHLWRINLFLMPCFTLLAPEDASRPRRFRAWVPEDDEHTSVLTVVRPAGVRPPGRRARRVRRPDRRSHARAPRHERQGGGCISPAAARRGAQARPGRRAADALRPRLLPRARPRRPCAARRARLHRAGGDPARDARAVISRPDQ